MSTFRFDRLWNVAVAFRWYLALGATLLAIVAALALRGDNIPAEADASLKGVTVASIDTLSTSGGLSTIATIRSVREAGIAAETGGKITRVRAQLGDFVAAGSIIADIENAGQRAALLQAEGALEAARAAAPNVAVSLEGAETSAVNALLSAYAAAENAVREAIDDTFVNPEHTSRRFTVLTTESQLKTRLENERPTLSAFLARHAALSGALSSSINLRDELARTDTELRSIRAYLDMLITTLQKGIASPEMSQATIDGYASSAVSGRAAITTSLSALATARTALDVAENNAGSRGTSTADASLKQAQGAYDAALAALEKTYIRTPIAGTLNHFDLTLGDFVSPSQHVAVVANNGLLEAVAHIDENDRRNVRVGQSVTFEDGSIGRITAIAPALDPITRRVEIRIALANTSLANGSSIRVQFAPGERTTLSVPITALRISRDGAMLFIVENEILRAIPVSTGPIQGERVELRDIDPTTEIVTDVRGLKEGEKVSVTR